MKYALTTLVRKLRELAQRDEKQFSGPTVESEIIRQAATMLEKTKRQPAPAEVFVYHEYNDSQAYGEQHIKLFSERQKGIDYLRKRVKICYRASWEDVKETMVREDDTFEDDYVSIDTGNGVDFFILEPFTVN